MMNDMGFKMAAFYLHSARIIDRSCRDDSGKVQSDFIVGLAWL